MNRHLELTAPLLVAGALLGACAAPAPTQRLPDMTFVHLQALSIDVAKIEIENRFSAPAAPPHVEHLAPVSPAAALEQWATDRFRPVGRAGVMRLIIEDAKATETSLALDKSLKGRLTKQQSRRYDASVRATLELKNAAGVTLGSASASAERSITAREDISLNDREKLWYETVDLLMDDYNVVMEANVRRFLKRWLR